jgi:trehalose 6-phosphate phosphatase
MASDPLAPFRADPAGSALMLDIDGTLAPIVSHPDLAVVPDATLALVREAAARYRLVACVSGRSLADVRRLVPVPGLLASGNHGLEIDVGDGPRLLPEAQRWLAAMREFADGVAPVAASVGAWVEQKGPSLSVHWREARDPGAAETGVLTAAGPLAARLELVLRPGRMVLEVRPPVALHKGTAVAALLAARPCTRSLFCGDDVTDLDGFAACDVAVAVRSPEAPAGLLEAADVVVDDGAALLRALVT